MYVMNEVEKYMHEIREISERHVEGLEDIDTLKMTVAFFEMELLAFRMLAENSAYGGADIFEYIAKLEVTLASQLALLPKSISYRKVVDVLKKQLEDKEAKRKQDK